MAGRILPPLSLILPFWLVRSMVGWRDLRGLAGAARQRRVVRGHAVLLVELSGPRPGGHRRGPLLAAGMVAFLKVLAPAEVMPVSGSQSDVTATRLTAMEVLKGWSPFIIASI